MCDKDHFAESVAEYEARGLVTRRQFGVLLAACMLPRSMMQQMTASICRRTNEFPTHFRWCH
jgi:hypothetical protein